MQTLTNTNQQQPVGIWASQKDTPVHEQREVEVMPVMPVMLRPPAQPQPQTPHCNTGDCVSSSPCNPWNFLPLPRGIWCQLMSPDPGLL